MKRERKRSRLERNDLEIFILSKYYYNKYILFGPSKHIYLIEYLWLFQLTRIYLFTRSKYRYDILLILYSFLFSRIACMRQK